MRPDRGCLILRSTFPTRLVGGLMVLLVVVCVALGVVNLLNLIAPLILLSGADFLTMSPSPNSTPWRLVS